MEYYNVNKKRIPVFGFSSNLKIENKKELIYFDKSNLLISKNYLLIITTPKNLEYYKNVNINTLLFGVKISNLKTLKNLKTIPNFIILSKIN